MTYEPGTVAVATVRGVKGVRVMRRTDHHGKDRWEPAFTVDGWLGHDDEHVTDVRPLVVLDLDEIGWSADHLTKWLRDIANFYDKFPDKGNPAKAVRLADQIEAQAKPPRIPEPTGFAAVVEAGSTLGDPNERRHWVSDGDGSWLCSTDLHWSHEWDQFVDPVLIRDGIEES